MQKIRYWNWDPQGNGPPQGSLFLFIENRVRPDCNRTLGWEVFTGHGQPLAPNGLVNKDQNCTHNACYGL